MKKDLLITFLSQFFILVMGIIVFRVAYRTLGGEGFSEYTISRKNLSLLEQIIGLGMYIGIPRYIAYGAERLSNRKNADMYFFSGVIIISISIFIGTLILNTLKGPISYLIFGSNDYGRLVLALNIAIIGLMAHVLVYSFYRGYMRFHRTNLIQVINLGCVPILAFIIGRDAFQVITITGLTWIVISAVPFVFIMKNLNYSGELMIHIRELLPYGMRRLPGDIAHSALFTLPAIFVAHTADLKTAGYVAFGISLLTMTGALFGPIGLVLLPKVSQIVANNDRRLLKFYVFRLLKITVLSVILGVVIFEIFAKIIITSYLGEESPDIVLISRIILIGGLAYPVYTVMRSIIDAYYVQGINSTNLLISTTLYLMISAITFLLGGNYYYILIAFVSSVFILGGLSLVYVRKIINEIK